MRCSGFTFAYMMYITSKHYLSCYYVTVDTRMDALCESFIYQ